MLWLRVLFASIKDFFNLASYKYSIPNDWGLTTKKVCAKIKSHAETGVGSARFWYNKL